MDAQFKVLPDVQITDSRGDKILVNAIVSPDGALAAACTLRSWIGEWKQSKNGHTRTVGFGDIQLFAVSGFKVDETGKTSAEKLTPIISRTGVNVLQSYDGSTVQTPFFRSIADGEYRMNSKATMQKMNSLFDPAIIDLINKSIKLGAKDLAAGNAKRSNNVDLAEAAVVFANKASKTAVPAAVSSTKEMAVPSSDTVDSVMGEMPPM